MTADVHPAAVRFHVDGAIRLGTSRHRTADGLILRIQRQPVPHASLGHPALIEAPDVTLDDENQGLLHVRLIFEPGTQLAAAHSEGLRRLRVALESWRPEARITPG